MKNWNSEKVMELIKLRDSGLSWEELSFTFTGFSPNALRKAYYRYVGRPDVTNGAKVLIFDIETAPMEAYVWGLFDQTIGLEQIKQDWSVLSFSAKWLGLPEDEIMYYDNRNEKSPRNDKSLLKVIHSLLEEADVVIVQNGAKFDIPKLNARFILNGMTPPSSYRVIDTYKIAKKYFGFTSNKLAYMSDKLCSKYKKLEHSDFAGFKLWKECLNKNIKAWKSMEKYNKFDVLSLEELYFKLIPWERTISFAVYNQDMVFRCTCGNDKLKKNGFIYTNAGKYVRNVCTVCKKEYKDKKNLLKKVR